MPFRQFIYSLGSRSSAPGGGSASAAIGAMVSFIVKELIARNENTLCQSAVIEFWIAEVHITEDNLSLNFCPLVSRLAMSFTEPVYGAKPIDEIISEKFSNGVQATYKLPIS